MNRWLLLGCLVTALLLSGVASSRLVAEQPPLPDDQLARIRVNCSSAKASLNRIHASDALMRVNQGQIYELLSTQLMARFNSRVSLNRLDSTELVGVTADYAKELNTFRQAYQVYEQQLSAALEIDCTTRPQDFYYAVADARAKRATISGEVHKLNGYLSQYRENVDSFSRSYQAALQEVQNAQ